MRYICLVVLCFYVVKSARILGYFPTPSYSHQVTFQPIWKELSLRGHQVTVITPNPLRDTSLTNLREIDLQELSYEIWTKHNISTFGVDTERPSIDFQIFLYALLEVVDAQLSVPEVREIISNTKHESYDLLLVEYMIPVPYPLQDIFNCPMVGISSMPFSSFSNKPLGNPINPITDPDLVFQFSRNLTFLERLQSTLYVILADLLFNDFNNQLRNIMIKHFGITVRNFEDLAADVDLVLANANPVLQPPRPNVPNAIEFSGIHILKPKPLPKDLKIIMDNAKEGIIYTSFGSNIKSSSMSKNKLQIIIDTFSELPYKILWKFESDDIPKLPKNVIVRKWFPQQDILRHPNIKLFITQGGLQSLDEAMYTKTPMVVVPFFVDQPGNAKKIENLGIGKSLRFSELSKHGFKDTILEVLKEKYYKRAEEVYKILIDQPMSALDKSVWWIEYVIRHKNISHLKSPSRNLPWYQYLLLDVIGFVLACVTFMTFLLIKVSKYATKKIKAMCSKKLKTK